VFHQQAIEHSPCWCFTNKQSSTALVGVFTNKQLTTALVGVFTNKQSNTALLVFSPTSNRSQPLLVFSPTSNHSVLPRGLYLLKPLLPFFHVMSLAAFAYSIYIL
jgi:hypothetical protein